MTKYLCFFDEGQSDKDLLGGKGANLAVMTGLGLPVPPGFTITTAACRSFNAAGQLPDGLWDEVKAGVTRLEQETGKGFGSAELPLLVSVRSGAKFSMPGMMDTVLNLGLNDRAVNGLARASSDERFAWDAYRRLITMYGDVVQDVPRHLYDAALDRLKGQRGAAQDIDLNAEDLRSLVTDFKAITKKHTGADFPQDPWQQLCGAVEAVFSSWMNPRAMTYRRLHDIPHDLGTAVNVQAMVFGNLGQGSGTGVGFTRNPATGQTEPYGEFLMGAQGEDVVAGVRTPQSLAALETALPEVYRQLLDVTQGLETKLGDVQDFEFTVERGTLYMLQTRAGKRTARAGVKIAVDFVHEGRISKEEALSRVDPESLNQLLHPQLQAGHHSELFTTGLPASPGAASGVVVLSADEAARRGAHEPVILVTAETSPEDIHGLAAAAGILTARGGMTSHAAVVARGMGKPAVVGAEALKVGRDSIQVGDVRVAEGETLTLDGATGEVFLGDVPTEPAELTPELLELLGWADAARRLGVRANADTPADAVRARELGAQGIGLCRTEHMFFGADRLPHMRALILSDSEAQEKAALARLQDAQRADFYALLLAMDGLPVTVRLLDPPLHEFLPSLEELAVRVAQAGNDQGREAQQDRNLLARVRALHEVNPMMGLRGIRLGLTRPAITRMQVRALAEATAQLLSEGHTPLPELMVPLVGTGEELRQARELIEDELKGVEANGQALNIPIGTMIEVPRACLVAGELARHADFFSFGTNDLTQMSWGYSRDDAQGKFIPQYLETGILERDPFATLDQGGVGRLIQLAVKDGRAANPTLKIGICGEHGGDPASVEFFNASGLDYVSCSPFRVPVARLAAARAALQSEERTTA